MKRWLFVLVLVAGCGDGFLGSPRACTAIGCASQFQVRLSRPSGWPAATYRVEVTADGQRRVCEIDIPLRCDAQPRCTGSGSWFVTRSGCALDPSQHSLPDVTFTEPTPSRVELAVFQADRSLGSGSYTPVYTTSRPNGPDCEPVCRSAPPQTLALTP